RDCIVLDDSFQLRAEDKLAIDIGVIERLFSYPIARQQHPLVSPIPDGEREHPTEHRDTSLAKIFVKMKDGLGIGICSWRMAARAKHLREFPVVVNFAIEDNGDISFFIEYRLMATFHINDREAAVTEADPGLDVKAIIVRPTMRNHVCHPAQRLGLDRLVVIVMIYATYSAHKIQPIFCLAESFILCGSLATDRTGEMRLQGPGFTPAQFVYHFL